MRQPAQMITPTKPPPAAVSQLRTPPTKGSLCELVFVDCAWPRGVQLTPERNYPRVVVRPAYEAGILFDGACLEQALLHFFLAGNTVLGPRHCLQPLLLHLFLAVGANAVFIFPDAL